MHRSKCYSYFFVEMRQRGRLAGFSLYLSTTGVINDSIVCYKDGPLLPSLNFTTDCIGSGRFVIFFNERLSETSYPEGYETTSVTTELCEVIVQGTFLQPYNMKMILLCYWCFVQIFVKRCFGNVECLTHFKMRSPLTCLNKFTPHSLTTFNGIIFYLFTYLFCLKDKY